MNDNKNEKSVEELEDEALDAVTGGGRKPYVRPVGTCPECHQQKEKLAYYHDPEDPKKSRYMCADCARDLGYVL